ncbi:hypothetical protein Ocin01_13135 [Orchesella cincta]|uniref:Uncharacterized protein n=1 Tax=Orchesella cincta TaxID=48709 RepID=A0A1D2MKP1_ORCCI|nr:hypothetical protein Ocin01_13135 [Orchesella cincta]
MMLLFSRKFLGILVVITLLSGGFQATQGIKCRKCNDCHAKNLGKSVKCKEPCFLEVKTSPLKTTINRGCCKDCARFEMEKCEAIQVFDDKYQICYCDSADDCNLVQIDGVPDAGGALSANKTIFFTITTIMIIISMQFFP